MIIDSVSKLSACLPLLPKMSGVMADLERLSRGVPSSFKEGRNDLRDGVYVMLVRDKGRDEADALLEVHDRYADIHISFAGDERIGWRPRSWCKRSHSAVSEDTDVGFFADDPEGYASMTPGLFALFMPEDAHMPMLADGQVEKVIVKVPL